MCRKNPQTDAHNVFSANSNSVTNMSANTQDSTDVILRTAEACRVQTHEGNKKSNSSVTNSFIANEFQCFKAENARKTYESLKESIYAPPSYFEKNLQESLQEAPNRIEAYTQAMRILKGLPRLAEKKSRLFIPYFLDWTKSEQAPVANEGGENGDQRL